MPVPPATDAYVDAPLDAVVAVKERNRFWLERYAVALVALDLAGLGLVGIVAVLSQLGPTPTLGSVSYFAVAGLLVLGWLATLALSRCYETRFVGAGPEEFRRVGNASVRVTAGVALVAFALKLPLSRVFLGVFLVMGAAVLLLGRYAARLVLRRGRRQGLYMHRVLLVGSRQAVVDLAALIGRDPLAGLQIVGACLPGEGSGEVELEDGQMLPVVGSLSGITEALLAVHADTIAVAASPGITGAGLKQLSYELEGTGVDLLVAPALTNVTGTRVSIRPMAGLPLLHLEEPELSGVRQLVKTVFDVVVATLLLILAAPLLLALAVLVRLTSPGPALFRQERVGRAGSTFRVWKFRSMYVGAEECLEEMRHLNEHDGVLFKLRGDPRVTPLGRILRKYSLDELPQLANVLRGHMSLVGPRPPLPSEVARYEGHTRRRLLVKPGITGLWQVSGRSNLSWEETVRLDLQYVENWSLGLDITVLARTFAVVIRGSGAY